MVLIIFPILLISIISATGTVGQTQNDIIEKRDNYVIRFVRGGPDLQFFLRADENDSGSQFRYTLKWKELVEYSDSDSNGLFDNTIDDKISSKDLTSLNFDYRSIWGELHNKDGKITPGRQFNFSSSFSQGINNAKFSIAVDWWDDDVELSYAGEMLKVSQKESKFSFSLTGWGFASPNNRIALLVEIDTTTPIEKYAVATFDNGTFGMLTKENVDGKGHRGGIIKNPLKVELDNSIANVNTSVSNNGVSLDFQYSFPSFSESLFYDPSYAAVSVPNLSEEFLESDNVDQDQGVPGFEFEIFFVSIIGFMIITRKIKNK
jgi:hypothetical protein